MARFKEGDRVRFIGNNKDIKNESGVLEDYKGMSIGDHRWVFKPNDHWIKSVEVLENELELIYRKPEELKACQCGAHASSFPTFHSDWCAMYKGNVK